MQLVPLLNGLLIIISNVRQKALPMQWKRKHGGKFSIRDTCDLTSLVGYQELQEVKVVLCEPELDMIIQFLHSGLVLYACKEESQSWDVSSELRHHWRNLDAMNVLFGVRHNLFHNRPVPILRTRIEQPT